MIKRRILATLAALSLLYPLTAAAQDDALIVVTGARSDRDNFDRYYDSDQSAIGLKRRADYFVTPIYVSSDSREEELRNSELQAMLQATIEQAEREGIVLVAGAYTLRPLTLENRTDLSIRSGRRPDTSRVEIYVRLPIEGENPSVDAASERIGAFVEGIPATGRSFIETGSTQLAINNPDQYRGDVVRTIADEANRYASMFGSNYGVEIRGLDSELFWQQASETEVFLYIEHNFIIRPR